MNCISLVGTYDKIIELFRSCQPPHGINGKLGRTADNFSSRQFDILTVKCVLHIERSEVMCNEACRIEPKPHREFFFAPDLDGAYAGNRLQPFENNIRGIITYL